MSYYLFQPDAELLSSSGYSSVAGVPVIFTPDWSYAFHANRYLREKARLELGLPLQLTQLKYPTRRTLETYGQSLCNFLEWCDARSVSWENATFTRHILDGYQSDMLRGLWSVHQRPLQPRTVNLRVTVAIEFLTWAGVKRLREPFAVSAAPRRIHVPSHETPSGRLSRDAIVRAGKVRPKPTQLRIPTDQEIAAWRSSVALLHGPVNHLIVDLILATGIRREEAAQWRFATLPVDKASWRIRGGFVTVTIEHGTKGAKYTGANGEEVGPSRNIDMPLALAERLHDYRALQRPALAAKYVRAASSIAVRRARAKEVASYLFLSTYSGKPVTGAALYRAWTKTYANPFAGWSPHAGRHYWACKTLMSRTGQLWKAAPEHYDLTASATDVMLLHIQPQLGHVNSSTTQIYLNWLERTFLGTNLYDRYVQSLENIVGE